MINMEHSGKIDFYFYPAALKGTGVLLSPVLAGMRQGREGPLTLLRP